MHLTFELRSVDMSDTFWVASPPIFMALCVAWEASFDAEEENNDHPWNYLNKININKLFKLVRQGKKLSLIKKKKFNDSY